MLPGPVLQVHLVGLLDVDCFASKLKLKQAFSYEALKRYYSLVINLA